MSHDIWSIVCLAGLIGWITSALFLAFKAFPSQGKLSTRPAITWGVALILSYAVWIAGLLNA